MSVTVTDNFTPQTWGESYPKTWGSANYITWKFGLHDYNALADGTLTLADAMNKAASHKENEDVSVDDAFSREVVWERTLAETLSIMETYWDVIQFHVNVSESFSITDEETNRVIKGVNVTLHIEDKVPKSVVKFLPITIFVQEDFFRKTKTFRNFAETIHADEVVGKHPSIHFEEVFGIVDFFTKMFTKNCLQTITLTELLHHAFSAKRVFAETVAFNELLKKHPEINRKRCSPSVTRYCRRVTAS